MNNIFIDGVLELCAERDPVSEVKILFTGDICPRGNAERRVIEGKTADIIAPVKKILADKDISIGNLEAPLTRVSEPIEKTGPNLRLDPACVDFLLEAGIDIANLANNHIGDYGPEGVIDTLEVLDHNGILSVGAGEDLGRAREPLFICKKDINIAILSFAENEFTIAGEKRPGAAPMDPISNCSQIREAAGRADIVLVLIHGGNEYCPIPSPRMVQLYREYGNAGASAVIATHPHCPQGVEIYKGIPIVYSLGNFLFDTPLGAKDDDYPEDSMWWNGYMACVSFSRKRAVAIEVIPHTFQDRSQVRPFVKEQRKQFLDYIQHISDIIPDENELQQLWQAWCMYMKQSYISYFKELTYPASKDEDKRRLLIMRNLFHCEAHHEVVSTILQTIYEGKEEAGEQWIPRIEKLQKGIIV